MKIAESALTWAQRERKLSRATLERLPVASGTTFFPDLANNELVNPRSEALFFKYAQGWKARSFPEKSFVAGGGFKASFWNLETVLAANPGTVFIAEGELDACALVEAGVAAEQVLSVPTGASVRRREDVAPIEERGYGYILDALKAGLSRAKKFVWCGDADEPGLALRADMARILGAARFMYVTWPQGVNDPNGMLIQHGADALHELVIHKAAHWPQEGLYRLSELPEPPALTIWTPTLGGFEDRVRFAPRTLSVVTGHPGMGKTICFGQIWFDLVKNYGLTCCIASFETRPRPHIRRQLRTLLTGKLEIELSEGELAQADQWIEDRYLFLNHPEQTPTLDWILECAETAVVRHGAKIIQIDPWNRLEGSRGRDENETDYILRCLRTMYVFAQDMDCHLQVVAHPSKMDSARRGQPPSLEDIAGSKHWENIVDQGFVVHRPQMFEGTERKTVAAFYHRKARFEELGYPCKIMLNYDLGTRRYAPLVEDQ